MATPLNQMYTPFQFGAQSPPAYAGQNAPMPTRWDMNYNQPVGTQFNAGTFGASQPTVGPLDGNYTAELDRQGVSFQTPQVGGGGSDNSLNFGEWTKLGTGIANAYLGNEARKLGKQQFGFAKDSFNTNLANQAQLINNTMETNRRKRLETSGQYGSDATGQANLQTDLQSYLQPRRVSGAAI